MFDHCLMLCGGVSWWIWTFVVVVRRVVLLYWLFAKMGVFSAVMCLYSGVCLVRSYRSSCPVCAV